MQPLLTRYPYIGFIGVIFFGLTVSLAFLSKYFFNDSRKKIDDDKALLKQLLEGFGLDVPSELREPESKVIKSIKMP